MAVDLLEFRRTDARWGAARRSLVRVPDHEGAEPQLRPHHRRLGDRQAGARPGRRAGHGRATAVVAAAEREPARHQGPPPRHTVVGGLGLQPPRQLAEATPRLLPRGRRRARERRTRRHRLAGRQAQAPGADAVAVRADHDHLAGPNRQHLADDGARAPSGDSGVPPLRVRAACSPLLGRGVRSAERAHQLPADAGRRDGVRRGMVEGRAP